MPSFIVNAVDSVLLPTDESPIRTLYCARFAALENGVSAVEIDGRALSQMSTSKPYCWPSCWISTSPSSIDSCRKSPVLFANTSTLKVAFGLCEGAAGVSWTWRLAPASGSETAPRPDSSGPGRPRSWRITSCASVTSSVRASPAGTSALTWPMNDCRPPMAATLSPAVSDASAAASESRSVVTSAAARPERPISASMSVKDVVTISVQVILVPRPALSPTCSAHVCLPSESLDTSSGSG